MLENYYPSKSAKAFLLLLGLLLVVPLQAQPVLAPELDSLRKAFALSKADTNRVKLLLRLGEHQVYKPGEFKADMDSARQFALQAQQLSRQLGYYQGEGRSLNLLGTISRESRQLEQSVVYHQSALQLYRQRGDWQGEADSYLLLAWARRDKGDVLEARKEVQRARELYQKQAYYWGVGQSWLEQGNTYANWGEELNTKIGYYEQSLAWFERAQDRKKQADVRKDLGDLYHLQGNQAQALLQLRKALALYQSIGYRELQGVYDLMGYVSNLMGDFQQGLRYGLLAVRTAEARKDTSLQLCTIYNRVGITYFNLQQFQKAYSYYKKSLSVAQQYEDLSSILLLTGNISQVFFRLKQPREALSLLLKTIRRYPLPGRNDSIAIFATVLTSYSHLKQYATAQQYCNQLLLISSKMGKNDPRQQYVYKNVISFLLASEQYEQARIYTDKLQLHSTETRDPMGKCTSQWYWFRLDSARGNYLEAIRHYQLYDQLRDSLLNEAKSRQIADLEVLHETERKEKDLQLKEQSIKALTREKQLQQQQMAQDKLVRNVIIAGALMLTLLLVVIYNRYRVKQRSNEQLQAQQQQLQAQQQEIYHKNAHLSQLLIEKDALIEDKEALLQEKDTLLDEQQRLLEEKERLLKEIHHRVKNNLQVVMSLLNSQAASLEDQSALSAIQESQHRVQAMALIHQKLYQAEGVSRIPMKAYIEEVLSYLHDSYQVSGSVRFELQVDDIELDVVQAVPLGLIINEAVTNAFKYAFPQGASGTLRLELQQLGEQRCQLVIADDGVGLPQGYERRRSLGMTLLQGFSEQLEGELSILSPPGTTIQLVFPLEAFRSVVAGETSRQVWEQG